VIYFIGCAAANAVKIGTTEKSWRVTPLSAAFFRLGQAQVNCPFDLELRAVCEGGPEEEAALHERFAEHHIRGEWFTVAGDLKGLLDRLPVPPKMGRGWHFNPNHPARQALPPFPLERPRPHPERYGCDDPRLVDAMRIHHGARL
jgi:hypothetical protein